MYKYYSNDITLQPSPHTRKWTNIDLMKVLSNSRISFREIIYQMLICNLGSIVTGTKSGVSLVIDPDLTESFDDIGNLLSSIPVPSEENNNIDIVEFMNKTGLKSYIFCDLSKDNIAAMEASISEMTGYLRYRLLTLFLKDDAYLEASADSSLRNFV